MSVLESPQTKQKVNNVFIYMYLVDLCEVLRLTHEVIFPKLL